MRIKAVKLDDYKSDKGLQLDVNTSPVWQFLVSEEGSVFLDWLKPTKEYVKPKVENRVSLFDLANMISSGGSTEPTKQTTEDLKLNPSVAAIGVSQHEFTSDKAHWLSFGVPLFVSVDLNSFNLTEVQTWLESYEFDPQVIYVLDLGLTYTEIHTLTTYLKIQKVSEEQIRLVGDYVFKYKGQNYCGLFSPSFAKKYKLEFVYDSEPHKATQIFLSKDGVREVPIEDCTYPKLDKVGGI